MLKRNNITIDMDKLEELDSHWEEFISMGRKYGFIIKVHEESVLVAPNAAIREIIDNDREFIQSRHALFGIDLKMKVHDNKNDDRESDEAYKRRTIDAFFMTRCFYNEGSLLSREHAYAAFCDYCIENRIPKITKETFERHFKPIVIENGFKDDTNGKGGRRYKNLAVKVSNAE